jgi:hypothetical protein
MCLYEDATREDILSRYPWTSLLSGVSNLSYRSVPYFMYWFRVQIFDSDYGRWLYVLGPIMNCMYLVWIDLDFINTCNLICTIYTHLTWSIVYIGCLWFCWLWQKICKLGWFRHKISRKSSSETDRTIGNMQQLCSQKMILITLIYI